MRVYPAVDIREGQAVRLKQGKADQKTVYFDDPTEPARRFQAAGSEWIHVVDLDGAFDGLPKNLEIIRRICALGMKVEMGGGLRTREAVDAVLEAGVDRAIIGTRACTDPDFLDELVAAHGDAIAVGIDAKDGKVATRGWVDTSEVDAFEMARRMADKGVAHIIYTDISRDGMMSGPNYEAQEAMHEAISCRLIASGGVSKPEDIERFRELGQRLDRLEGVIVGRAIYDETVKLEGLF